MNKELGWAPVPTKSEERARKILEDEGFSISCNQLLFGYYPDIRINGTNLLIEIDGGYHDTKAQQQADKIRSKHLAQRGFKILRFENRQTLDRDFIVGRVRHALGFPKVVLSPDKVKNKHLKTKKRDKKIMGKKGENAVMQSGPCRRLTDNPEWEEAACKKLGIVPKPKRAILDLSVDLQKNATRMAQCNGSGVNNCPQFT